MADLQELLDAWRDAVRRLEEAGEGADVDALRADVDRLSGEYHDAGAAALAAEPGPKWAT